jgi:ABC-2 type transport system permease protein
VFRGTILVAAWEVLVAVGLLLVTIWLLRKAAARIFRLAMLMHGKEPSLREMARWLYEA